TCGFKSSRKASPYAGQRTAVDAIRTVGLQRAEVMVKGAGSGRDAALRAIAKSGVRLSCIRDVTPMPHNGCRPPKKRCLQKSETAFKRNKQFNDQIIILVCYGSRG